MGTRIFHSDNNNRRETLCTFARWTDGAIWPKSSRRSELHLTVLETATASHGP